MWFQYTKYRFNMISVVISLRGHEENHRCDVIIVFHTKIQQYLTLDNRKYTDKNNKDSNITIFP